MIGAGFVELMAVQVAGFAVPVQEILAAPVQGEEVTEYPEPYFTIYVVSAIVLLFAYVCGVPTTVAVTAVLWRQRTRFRAGQQLSPGLAASAPHVPAPPPPTTLVRDPQRSGQSVPMNPVSPAAGVGQDLLRLQTLEHQVLELRERSAPAETYTRLAGEAVEFNSRFPTSTLQIRYVQGLRAIIAALAPAGVPGVLPAEPPETTPGTGDQLPDLLRVALARFALEGRVVPANWAYAWLEHLPDWKPRVAAYRREQLARAFVRRYQEKYPHGGMILALTGKKLFLTYAPASARFGGRPIEVATGLPDVSAQTDAVRRLWGVGGETLRDLGLTLP